LKKLLREVFFFGLVGVFGFVVDAAILYILKDSLGLFYARFFSFLAAVFSTWVVNRSLTFRDRKSGLSARREFSRYLLFMLGGGIVNYGVYAWLIVSYLVALENPILGVAAGSLAGMTVNLLSSRLLLYRFGIDNT
jgi:putative flippase GtrA